MMLTLMDWLPNEKHLRRGFGGFCLTCTSRNSGEKMNVIDGVFQGSRGGHGGGGSGRVTGRIWGERRVGGNDGPEATKKDIFAGAW